MQLFGKQISARWLWLLVPMVVAGLPLVGMLLIFGGSIAGGIFGPPAIWDHPYGEVALRELVGTYRESSRNLDAATPKTGASLVLREDGTMKVAGLPSRDDLCLLSGEGRWTRPIDETEIMLSVQSDGAKGSCASGSYGGVLVAGRRYPHRLYWAVGDPDSGTGIWLSKEQRPQ